jgi:hypothetical protein
MALFHPDGGRGAQSSKQGGHDDDWDDPGDSGRDEGHREGPLRRRSPTMIARAVPGIRADRPGPEPETGSNQCPRRPPKAPQTAWQ